MTAFAKFRSDGLEISREIFETLFKFASDGVMDVLACDQDNSVRKMLANFFRNAREAGKDTRTFPERSNDRHVAKICRIFAQTLGDIPAAALFNKHGFMAKGFRDILGPNTMLIARLERSDFRINQDKALLPVLDIEPEQIAGKVDAFKTLVKVDPNCRDSWEKNLVWLENVWKRCQRIGKPLFNEVLYVPVGLSKIEAARNLPEILPDIARTFGSYGHFYKTQVPLLWIEENGRRIKISSPDEVRDTAKTMDRCVNRPILLLSAAVDFEQYDIQYDLVCDLVSGPMCGRAYFKDPFSNSQVISWALLKREIALAARPRMELIQKKAGKMSQPWWHKCEWMSEEAEKLLIK